MSQQGQGFQEEIVEVTEQPHRVRWEFLPSVASWAGLPWQKQIVQQDLELTVQQEVEVTKLPRWELLPSVGTWAGLSRRKQIFQQRVGATVQKEVEVREPLRWQLLPSVGTWTGLQKIARDEDTMQEDAKPPAQRHKVQYKFLPSVGTWAGLPQQIVQQEEEVMKPRWALLPSVGSWAGLQRFVEPCHAQKEANIKQPEHPRQLRWELLPSVGTWIVLPQQERLAQRREDLASVEFAPEEIHAAKLRCRRALSIVLSNQVGDEQVHALAPSNEDLKLPPARTQSQSIEEPPALPAAKAAPNTGHEEEDSEQEDLLKLKALGALESGLLSGELEVGELKLKALRTIESGLLGRDLNAEDKQEKQIRFKASKTEGSEEPPPVPTDMPAEKGRDVGAEGEHKEQIRVKAHKAEGEQEPPPVPTNVLAEKGGDLGAEGERQEQKRLKADGAEGDAEDEQKKQIKFGLRELELRLRQRNDRLRRGNDALHRENARLRKLHECSEAAAKIGATNEKTRKDLRQQLGSRRRSVGRSETGEVPTGKSGPDREPVKPHRLGPQI